MENAGISKGVALFATLIGIYNWIGQGTSLFDIIIVLFAAALILNVDSHDERKTGVPLEQGETQNKQDFFRQASIPLRRCCLLWRQHFVYSLQI